MFCTAYSWRNVADKPWRRLTALVLYSLVLAGATVLAGECKSRLRRWKNALNKIAGVFSSQVTTQNAGNDVLLKGTNCGGVTTSTSPEKNGSLDRTAWDTYVQTHVTAYLEYASQCYSKTRSSFSEHCRTFVKPSLPYKINRNAPCPFATEICKNQTGNLILDTGMLDSYEELGLNAPKMDRFQMRNSRMRALSYRRLQ